VVFRFGPDIARVQLESSHAEIKVLGADDVSQLLERLAHFTRTSGDHRSPARLPPDVNADLRVTWRKPLPELRGVTYTPTVTADRQILTNPRYQPAAGRYYHAPGRPVPSVPERPVAEDLDEARDLLLNEWLPDFPFVDAAARAHVVAMGLTAICRDLIDGPTPLFAIDSPDAGTGKDLLALTTGIIVLGSEPAMMTAPDSDEELRKRVTALLMRGANMVVLDNVKGPLDSSELASVLTATVWENRILGASRTSRVPNRALWVANGNNLRLDHDIARRAVLIRIDPGLDRPWERTTFRHDPLAPWVREHREELIWAFLVLVQHWIVEGRPPYRLTRMGSFEAWGETIGGILMASDIPGFLENRDTVYSHADLESGEWRLFVDAWQARFGFEPVTIRDLSLLIQAGQLPSLCREEELSERPLHTKLGIALSQHRDHRFGDLFIRAHGEDTKSKAKRYRLEQAGEPTHSNHAEPSEPLQPLAQSALRMSAGGADLAESVTQGNEGSGGSAKDPDPVGGSRNPCVGGCGRLVPAGQRCTECADKSVHEWKSSTKERKKRRKRYPRPPCKSISRQSQSSTPIPSILAGSTKWNSKPWSVRFRRSASSSRSWRAGRTAW